MKYDDVINSQPLRPKVKSLDLLAEDFSLLWCLEDNLTGIGTHIFCVRGGEGFIKIRVDLLNSLSLTASLKLL